MKGDGEQEETQSNGRRPKAFSATMFLIGHRFESCLRRQKIKDYLGSPLFLSNPKDGYVIAVRRM